jgi:hypothetical protein
MREELMHAVDQACQVLVLLDHQPRLGAPAGQVAPQPVTGGEPLRPHGLQSIELQSIG